MGKRTSVADRVCCAVFTLDVICGKGYDQEGIQNTSLIYYLFIAEPINFTSAMKDVVGRERIIILSLIIPPN